MFDWALNKPSNYIICITFSSNICRSNRPKAFIKRLFLKIFQKNFFLIKLLAESMYFILLKKRLHHMCFYGNFTKCLWTPILENNCERTLLYFFCQFCSSVYFLFDFLQKVTCLFGILYYVLISNFWHSHCVKYRNFI